MSIATGAVVGTMPAGQSYTGGFVTSGIVAVPAGAVAGCSRTVLVGTTHGLYGEPAPAAQSAGGLVATTPVDPSTTEVTGTVEVVVLTHPPVDPS